MSRSGLRLAAYVLAGDAAWLRQSLESYYDLVDEIVVSYDTAMLGWTGEPVPVKKCLEIAASALDREQKVSYLQGEFWRPAFSPMENETHQRQVSLDAAANGADWIIQLDADEILLDPAAFSGALADGHVEGRSGLEYPARWMYAALGRNRYLEQSSRFGRLAAGYPGPVAVRPGTRLRVGRQGPEAAQLWRVDFRNRNTDPAHPRDIHIDGVVRPLQAILHLSWVRSERRCVQKSVHLDTLTMQIGTMH